MPITWRNVNQTMSSGTAAHMFDGAVNNITGGLDRIRGAVGQVIEGREKEHEFNVDKNTNAYFDALQQYQTPEELAAARESGALARLRQGFGHVIDEDRVRGAEDARERTLRTDYLADTEFANTQAMQAAEPLLEDLRARIARGEDISADIESNQDTLTNIGQFGALTEANVNAIKARDRAVLEDQRLGMEIRSLQEQERRTGQQQNVIASVRQLVAENPTASQAELREQFIGRHKDADPDIVSAGLQDLYSLHQQVTDLTPEEAADVIQTRDNLERQSTFQIQEAEHRIGQLQQEREGLNVFAWNDSQRNSAADVESNINDASAYAWFMEKLEGKMAERWQDVNEVYSDRMGDDGSTPTNKVRNENARPDLLSLAAERHRDDIALEVIQQMNDTNWFTGLFKHFQENEKEVLDIIDRTLSSFQRSQDRTREIDRDIGLNREAIYGYTNLPTEVANARANEYRLRHAGRSQEEEEEVEEGNLNLGQTLKRLGQMALGSN